MLNKEKVLKMIDRMPDRFTLDELVENLILLEKTEIGLRQAREGKVVNTEEAKKKLGR